MKSIWLTLAAGVGLAACESLPYEIKKRAVDKRASEVSDNTSADKPATNKDELSKSDAHGEAGVDEAGKVSGVTELIERETGSQRGSTQEQRSSIYAGTGRFLSGTHASLEDEKGLVANAVTLNLVDAPIQKAAQTIIGDILEANYIIEDGVDGTITLQTGNPIERDALLSVLETVLRPKGAAIVNEAGLYRIVPLATALRGGVGPSFQRGADLPGFAVHIEPLRYVSASEMARILEPIAPQGAILRVDQARNMLMLAGTQFELASLLDTIEIFDVDWLAGMSFGIYPIKSAAPQSIIEELEVIFANETQGPLEGIVRFVPNDRLNAVMAISPQQAMLRHAEVWISRLDAAGEPGAEQLFVYNVQNGSALELADVLQNVLTGTTSGTRPSLSVSPRFNPVEVSAPVAGSSSVQARSSSVSRNPRGFEVNTTSPLVSGEKVSVFPYDSKNALVIVATPNDYDSILSILGKLDVVSNQVLLEATIAEVALRDELSFGLQWFFEEGDHQITLSNAASGAVGSTFPGFSYVFAQNDVRVALNALSSITDVNIISSPSLMVVDNQTATLQVGDEVPVATQSSVSALNPNAPIVNTIEFRDTGVILRITPRVNDSGIVLLEIEQEVSDVVSTTSSGIDSPTIQQRRIETTVAVQDGQSLALGGLIEDGLTNTAAGVPIVSEIPLVGNLFKTRRDVKDRTELLVLITPRVIRDMREAQQVTEEFRRRLDAIEPFEERLN